MSAITSTAFDPCRKRVARTRVWLVCSFAVRLGAAILCAVTLLVCTRNLPRKVHVRSLCAARHSASLMRLSLLPPSAWNQPQRSLHRRRAGRRGGVKAELASSLARFFLGCTRECRGLPVLHPRGAFCASRPILFDASTDPWTRA
jgi:hypothetical protein